MICLISFGKFSDALPAFTCVSAIVSLWSIYLGLNILKFEWAENLLGALHANILEISFPGIILYLASDAVEE